MTVEAECADIMVMIGLRDGALAFDRVHEAKLRIGQEFVDQPDFSQGCNVIMRYASFPKGLKQCRRWIGFYGIKRLALKLLNEETGSARSGVRAD